MPATVFNYSPLPAFTFTGLYGHANRASTSFPLFIERKGCNTVTHWVSPLFAWHVLNFGNELIHPATEVPKRPFHVMNYAQKPSIH